MVRYINRNGNTMTTGGIMRWEMKKKAMSSFLSLPTRKRKRVSA